MTNSSVKTTSPVWHPFTQMKTSPSPLMVRRGEGVMLELEDGRQIVDCISSWWVNIHGHGHPVIAQAIYEQAQKLEQVIFAGFTHEPAENLANKLLEHLPENLSRVFFSDNGSTAVEVALKMAYQYWHNQGFTKRSKFIGFHGGYHGDTVGAMSVGAKSGFWEAFTPLLFQMDAIDFPSTFIGDDSVQEKERDSLDQLEKLLVKNPDSYAAIFIEPLIQGAGGMKVCRPEFLQSLQDKAHEHNVLLIYDEVMTGFGRTGDWFACVKSQTQPDIICLSKGISGGFLPLAVTIATDQIYSVFHSDDVHKAFYHSHSYTANPIACAAGLASLDLLEQAPQMFQGMEARHLKFLDKWISSNPKFEKIRTCGTIVAMNVCTNGNENYFSSLGPILRAKFLESGFLLRPLGNAIYLMPPYCISDEVLGSVYQCIASVIGELAPIKIRSRLP